MISSGKRLVTFLDANADFTSVNYLIDGTVLLLSSTSNVTVYLNLLTEFTNIWETAFDVIDPTFDCNVNRTKGDTATQMYLINHFLDTLVLGQPVPDVAKANVTNSVSGVGSLGQQLSTCVAANGRNPNFMLVDVRIQPVCVHPIKSYLFKVLRIWWRLCVPSRSFSKWRNLYPNQPHCHPHHGHFITHVWILCYIYTKHSCFYITDSVEDWIGGCWQHVTWRLDFGLRTLRCSVFGLVLPTSGLYTYPVGQIYPLHLIEPLILSPACGLVLPTSGLYTYSVGPLYLIEPPTLSSA